MIEQFRTDRAVIEQELSAFEVELAAARAALAPAEAAVETCLAARIEVNRLLGLVQLKDATLPVAVYNRYRDDQFGESRLDIKALADAREALRLVVQKIDGLTWRVSDHRESLRCLDELIAAASPRPTVETVEDIVATEPVTTIRKRARAKAA
jgi:hypothetical protein